MKDFVLETLSAPEQSDFHKAMLSDCLELVDMSRKKMSGFYDEWDAMDATFSSETVQDRDDKDAKARKEPEKGIVPVMYTQVMTFVSFCYSLYTQRERFFELLPMNKDSHASARIGEALLTRDLSYNVFEAKLQQFLLDIGKFGLGVLKTSWVEEKQRVREMQQVGGITFLGRRLGGSTVETVVEKVKYQGNRLTNISPYRFFPDVRLPIGRFQEGEFVASEDEYSYTTLKKMEKDGEVTGVDFIRPLSKERVHGTNRRHSSAVLTDELGRGGPGQSRGNVVITEVQRVIIPSQYQINGEPLGDEDYPVKYVVWIANDTRVIKCEPMGYLHDQFTYCIGEFSPDLHNFINKGLGGSIDFMQKVITWFINSRITSVRKVIDNKMIVDPTGIEVSDLQARRPVIRLKPEASGRDVRRYVMQLNVDDVTQAHLNDVQFLMKAVEQVTGISENLMGQFHGGRRSATEARNVQANAAARLKMVASVIFRTSLEPLGRQMLSNLRDGLDAETIVRVAGLEPFIEGAAFKPVSKSDLMGEYDFEVFDGTLPSEKVLGAQTLQEILTALISNPSVALALSMDPKSMLMEIMTLRGIRNPERFLLQPVSPQQAAGLLQQQQQLTAPNGQPNQPTTESGGSGGAGQSSAPSAGFGDITGPSAIPGIG